MSHHKAHNSLLIFAVTVFMVTVALYVYIYRSVNSQTLRVVLAKDIQKVQKMDKDQIAKSKELFDHSKPNRDFLESLFVPKKDIVSFIESIESVGDSTGAVVEITSIGEVNDELEPDSVVGILKAHVQAKGTWSQVSKVLVMLETMQKSVTLDKLRLDKVADTQKDSGQWNISVDIIVNTLK